MARNQDATWKALAEPARRRIVELLLERPRTTGELCESFEGLTRFGVMNHIGVLKEAGLIAVEKDGRQRINRLNPDPIRALYDEWMREYQVLWAGRLGRLKKHAERQARENAMNNSEWAGAPFAGLNIRQEVMIAAPPASVFTALTDGIGEWWGAPYLADEATARDVVIEPRLGGLFKEIGDDDDGYIWGTVDAVRRDRLLSISGRLGMRNAVAGNLRIELEAAGDGTRLSLEHRAVGALSEETEQEFTAGWNDLLATRLKGYLEKGVRPGIRARN